MSETEFTHVWYWRKQLPERKGQRCRRIGPQGSNGNIAIEFEDGYQVVAPRWAIRLVKPDDGEIGRAQCVVYEHEDGTFRWRLVRGERILALSPGRYSARESAHTVARAALKASHDARIIDE